MAILPCNTLSLSLSLENPSIFFIQSICMTAISDLKWPVSITISLVLTLQSSPGFFSCLRQANKGGVESFLAGSSQS
ncbi:hypothetical protein SCA6_012841 [Theobroma cacao]